jgi:hypothetical protein
MTIPGRRETALLLRSLEPPPWFLRHACAVADVAAWLAARAEANGHDVHRPLVEAAALLHDVDKLPSAGAPAGHRHGDGSAAWLERRGMEDLAPVVRDHPVTRLAEPGWDAWMRAVSLEARIVAYADKRAGQRLEPMAARFASWRRRYPGGPSERDGAEARGRQGRDTSGTDGLSTDHGWDDELAALVEARAAALERDVCGAARVEPAGVRRLRWSRRALREAAR